MRFDINLEGKGVIGIYDQDTRKIYLEDGHGLQAEQISRMKELLRDAPGPPPYQALPPAASGQGIIVESGLVEPLISSHNQQLHG